MSHATLRLQSIVDMSILFTHSFRSKTCVYSMNVGMRERKINCNFSSAIMTSCGCRKKKYDGTGLLAGTYSSFMLVDDSRKCSPLNQQTSMMYTSSEWPLLNTTGPTSKALRL